MRLSGFALHPYRLPLTGPVAFGGTALAHREGVLLRLTSETGGVGWGDAAPLPGFSRESPADARAALAACVATLDGQVFDPEDLADPDGAAHAALDAAGLPPSARFALDLALTDLAAQARGCSLLRVLDPDPLPTLPLNGLVMGDPEAVPSQAASLVRAGYRTLKLKVGRQALAADIALVNRVRARIGEGVALRLDANRAWTGDEARRFADGIAEARIAYIEEPLRDPAGLPALGRDTGLPIALDETLAEPGGPAALHEGVAAAVLKPTVLGGIAATLRWARAAREVGAVPVLSAAFESGVGLRGVAALAAVTSGEPAGLDPYRWLAADVLASPLPFDRPSVDLAEVFATPLDVRVDR